MTLEEYFGSWLKTFNKKEFNKIVNSLSSMYNTKNMCPSKFSDVFKSFNLCPYEKCVCIFLAQDPYPHKDIATGLCFANKQETNEENYSPSLKVIKDACVDLHYSNNSTIFDPTLESWARQGILLLNSALTTEVGKPGLHTMLWRPFISSFLKNYSSINTGIIYVLFGSQAQTFKPYIGNFNYIYTIEHPAYFARLNKEMPSDIFYEVNSILEKNYNQSIKWFNKYE